MVHWDEMGPWENQIHRGDITFDGDGRAVKNHTNDDLGDVILFSLSSSVTGQKITDIQPGTTSGVWAGSRVYMGGSVIHDTTLHGSNQSNGFKVTDPISGSTQELNQNGAIPTPAVDFHPRIELAGLGTSVPLTAPQTFPEVDYGDGGFAGNAGSGCQMDGGPASCSAVMGYLRAMGLTFAGGHIIAETWRQKHAFSHPPGVNGPTESWAIETYRGSWWEFQGRNEIEWPRRRVTESEATLLRDTVTAAANNTDLCRKYIKDLIEKVAELSAKSVISTNVETMFNTILNSRGDPPNSGGIFLGVFWGGSAGQSWDYLNGPGYAQINIGIRNPIPSNLDRTRWGSRANVVNGNIIKSLSTIEETGIITIHELMHAAGVRGAGSDQDFANAAAALAGVERPVFTENFQSSNYWGERLNQACGFPSLITHKFTNYVLYK